MAAMEPPIFQSPVIIKTITKVTYVLDAGCAGLRIYVSVKGQVDSKILIHQKLIA
jgi:hypothetical protein